MPIKSHIYVVNLTDLYTSLRTAVCWATANYKLECVSRRDRQRLHNEMKWEAKKQTAQQENEAEKRRKPYKKV